ncbi:MAG: STAS domain-containing protein [Limisphaerales bacterium]
MSVSPAKISVLVGGHFACVRITGRVNFASGPDFKTLLDELRQRGFEHLVLDLSECTLMDSTFLGVLVGFGLKLGATPQAPLCPRLELLNPNARITELLESLGVLQLFSIRDGPLFTPAGVQTAVRAPADASQAELTRACLEAHKTLMQINPDNIPRFKDVAQFLAEDLKKFEGAK